MLQGGWLGLLSERHALDPLFHPFLFPAHADLLPLHSFQASRRPHVESHIDVKDTTYDRAFNAVHGTTPDSRTTQIDVSERQFRERTRPIVTAASLSTHPSYEQASSYRKESFDAKHDSFPRRRELDTVDSRYPSREQVRVESTRTTVDEPKKVQA
jgi:hypothetical protein